MINKVFIATSLDGYIAGCKGEMEWLDYAGKSGNSDMGYVDLMDSIDAIIMGRKTYEAVRGFDIDWPYKKHIYVLSTSLKDVPQDLDGKITILQGNPNDVLSKVHKAGHQNLYIDGGTTIQNFLKEDLIDEMTITVIPVLLGGGSPLFGEIKDSLWFKCYATELFPGGIVQSKYRRAKYL